MIFVKLLEDDLEMAGAYDDFHDRQCLIVSVNSLEYFLCKIVKTHISIYSYILVLDNPTEPPHSLAGGFFDSISGQVSPTCTICSISVMTFIH